MSKRALRRHHARRVRSATQRSVAGRSKGLWLWDDPECFDRVVKGHDREQSGRRRLACGALPGAARRRLLDVIFNPLNDHHDEEAMTAPDSVDVREHPTSTPAYPCWLVIVTTKTGLSYFNTYAGDKPDEQKIRRDWRADRRSFEPYYS